ncbi:hypothetical protein [Aureliella helgolandensis]|uniref:Uncharacterized protein n=1 Tax=Aureliella helgolandensis TaxID=2527968 RepID=A0A518G1R1_9BACT|nr:hypothetical protein [Aureliella helgolandensis]QDV22533.1 hypothetical protein Q31a_08190 [Aureliella helgolandensis]
MRRPTIIAAATFFVVVFAIMSTACVIEPVKADDQKLDKVAPDELYVMLFRGAPLEESAVPARDHVLTLRVHGEKSFSAWLGDGYPKLDGVITVKDTKLHAKLSADFNATAGTFVEPIQKDTPIKPSQSGFESGIQPFYFIVTSDPLSNMK